MVTINEALFIIISVTVIYKIIEYWNTNPLIIIHEFINTLRFIKNLFK